MENDVKNKETFQSNRTNTIDFDPSNSNNGSNKMQRKENHQRMLLSLDNRMMMTTTECFHILVKEWENVEQME